MMLTISICISFVIYVLVVVMIFIKRWDEAVAEAKKNEQKEKELKKEREERLRFDGKQNRLFYHIIWKNFKSNWKDYLLILISNIILFAVIVVAFCMKEILDGKYEIENRHLRETICFIYIDHRSNLPDRNSGVQRNLWGFQCWKVNRFACSWRKNARKNKSVMAHGWHSVMRLQHLAV